MQPRRSMNRRDLLRAGTLLSLGGSGCASLSATSSGGDGALGDFLSALDGMREAIGRSDVFAGFRDSSRPDFDALVERRAELTRKTFRSLMLTGALAELPVEQRSHVEVQRRLADSMQEMDDAMFGMTELLEELPASERADVGRALRDDPLLGMRIMGEVDREAASLGVSMGVRTRMRSVSTHVVSRLRQSPDLTIAEYTGKFRKLEARHGARAEAERQVATALASELLWQQATPSEVAAAGGTAPVEPQRCVTSKDCAPSHECRDYQDLGEGNWSPGVCQPRRRVRRSPVTISVGAASLGVGALIALPFIGSGLGTVYFITLGAVIALSGLIVLIVGLALAGGGR